MDLSQVVCMTYNDLIGVAFASALLTVIFEYSVMFVTMTIKHKRAEINNAKDKLD